jgi:predicted DNA-binding protein with PD1-like motif
VTGAGLRIDWPGSATRYLAVRLLPGEDLRQRLTAIFGAEPEAAGFVAAGVGSLGPAVLRLAGRDDALTIAGPLEIVALSGTLSVDGPHLHLAVADARGRVTGGHLMAGAIVRTTAEVVLGLAAGVQFHRATDPRTGFAELSMSGRAPA